MVNGHVCNQDLFLAKEDVWSTYCKLLCIWQKFGNSPIGPHYYHYPEKRQNLWENVLNTKCVFHPST
jgi:hypothetical protein